MSRTTYRVVEIFQAEVTEEDFPTLAGATRQIAARVADLVAEGATIVFQEEENASLLFAAEEGAKPTRLGLFVATVEPLEVTDVTDYTPEQMADYLGLPEVPETYAGGRRYYQ
jgi:hypothetical protein